MLRCARLAAFFFLFLLFHSGTRAQVDSLPPRPKVGLVLSGGGAKGIAHIPLLKLIDSLGIKVDYITGTSMGSVVGGLYAIGYTGQEIEDMVRHINWDVLLSNKVYLNAINIEEKDEFGAYQAELPTTHNYRPKLPLGIIEGQGLLEFLSQLTFHVSGINNFDSLPIPFRCMAADIISGKPIVLRQGYLPLAMRASMAIPTVFTPIDADTMLLVDGGLVKNFPVEQAREMGADFIIGAYTGGQLYKKEELNSFIKLLYQSSSFIRLEDSELQKKLCDIFVNSNEELDGFGAVDFNKTDQILAMGDKAARLQLPLLIELANAQKPYHPQIIRVSKEPKPIQIDAILYKGKKENRNLATGKFGVRKGDVCSVGDLTKATNNVFGTRFFENVHYELQRKDTSNQLLLVAEETPPGSIKIGVHYDNYQHAGVLINYTARNLLGNASRLLFTFDFAQNPKARLSYYKFLDAGMKYSLYTEFLYENTSLVTYDLGKRNAIFIDNYLRYNLFFRYSRSKSTMYYAGPEIEGDKISPFGNPLESTNNAEVEIVRYRLNRWSFQAGYKQNTLDLPNFARSGHTTDLNLKFIPNMYGYTNLLMSYPDSVYEQELDYVYEPVLKVDFRFRDYKQIAKRHVLILTARAGITLMSNKDAGNALAGTLLEAEKYWYGGQVRRPRNYYQPLIGFNEYEHTVSQILVYQMEWRWNIFNNFYFTPAWNVLLAGSSFNGMMRSLSDVEFDYARLNADKVTADIGFGCKVSLDTRLGPVFFAASNSVASPSFRYAWGFGLRMQ